MADVTKMQVFNELLNIRDAGAPREESTFLSELAGKNLLIIGDSWLDKTATTSYPLIGELVATWLGMTALNYSVSGAGFYRPAQPNNFTVQTNTAAAAMSEAQKENTPLCLLVGGVNDAEYDDVEVQSSVRAFIQNFQSKFPNTKLLYVCNAKLPITATNMGVYDGILYIMANLGKKQAITLDWAPYSLTQLDEYYQPDGLHLTQYGHQRIASNVCNSILGGTLIPRYDSVLESFAALSGNNVSFFQTPDVVVNGDIVTVSRISLILGTLPFGATTMIGKVAKKFTPDGTTIIPCYSDDFVIIGCLIILNSGTIHYHRNTESTGETECYSACASYRAAGRIAK